jgi:hypothetical protein
MKVLICILLFGFAAAVDAQPAAETGQEPVARSFTELKTRIPSGGTIFVTDAAGREVRGKLSEVSETSFKLLVDGRAQTFSQATVAVIRQREADSLWNGLLIGVAGGSVPAVYWLITDPNECGNSICVQDLVIGAVPGALLGLAIDRVVQRKVVVYRGPSPSSKRTSFAVTPIVGHRRKGIGLTISFAPQHHD